MKLPKKVREKLGTLLEFAELTVAEVIRRRGGTASNVRWAGHWANRTLAEAAQGAVDGDLTAIAAIKIAKDARRLGEKY